MTKHNYCSSYDTNVRDVELEFLLRQYVALDAPKTFAPLRIITTKSILSKDSLHWERLLLGSTAKGAIYMYISNKIE